METKTYRIGGYRMQFATMSLALRERLDGIFAEAGMTSLNDLLEHTFNEVMGTINTRRIFGPLFENILMFHDRTPLHRMYREWVMGRRKQTKLSIVMQMDVPTQVEVFTDFFTEKLGAVILFGDSLKNMASSLKAREKADPSGTSSIS